MADSELGGLLRGVVVDNKDPEKLGRLKVRVQAAYGEQPVDNLPWAWPCFCYGGMLGMFTYAVPEIGAGVWVMFLNKDGEPDATYPVWLGTWQGKDEKPIQTDGITAKKYWECHWYKEFQTTSGHSLWISDKPKEQFIDVRDKDGNSVHFHDYENEKYVEIKDRNGSYILMKDGNIEIHAAGNIKLTAGRIDLN